MGKGPKRDPEGDPLFEQPLNDMFRWIADNSK